MKNFFLIIFQLSISISFGQNSELFLGQKVDTEQDITKSLIMVDSSQLSPKREKKINNINYTYATDS